LGRITVNMALRMMNTLATLNFRVRLDPVKTIENAETRDR